jgi:hypothetical protein
MSPGGTSLELSTLCTGQCFALADTSPLAFTRPFGDTRMHPTGETRVCEPEGSGLNVYSGSHVLMGQMYSGTGFFGEPVFRPCGSDRNEQENFCAAYRESAVAQLTGCATKCRGRRARRVGGLLAPAALCRDFGESTRRCPVNVSRNRIRLAGTNSGGRTAKARYATAERGG